MFAFIDWGSLGWPHYLAIGGGVVLVLALLLYFLLAGAREGLRIPGIVAGSLSGLALGVGVGIIGMTAFGYQVNKPEHTEDPRANMQGQGGFPGGGPPGGGRGGMMPGGRGSNPKQQLAQLVRKLDVLTDTEKPLTVTLSSDDKKKILKQLKDLDTLKELKDDDAQTRLKELLTELEPQRATLEAAGYSWPRQGRGGRGGPGGAGGPGRGGRGGPGGAGGPPGGFPGGAGGFGGGRQPPPANPFTLPGNKDALKALEKRLGQ